jgi:hypothetical protein
MTEMGNTDRVRTLSMNLRKKRQANQSQNTAKTTVTMRPSICPPVNASSADVKCDLLAINGLSCNCGWMLLVTYYVFPAQAVIILGS